MTTFTGDIIELAGGVPALHHERKGQLNRSKLKNWVEKNGGLPPYINSVATALLREHPEWGISRIIATAVNWAKKTCATGKAFGGKVSVSKAVQAAACNAVRQWEQKKAKASIELDEEVFKLSKDDWEFEIFKAHMRRSARAANQEVTEIINMSDELYFGFIESETDEPIELSWSSDEGVNDVDNVEAFIQVMELSAAAQSAVRLPLNLSEASKVGNNKYKKELLRVGEIIVDKLGNKFNFTADFLRSMKRNFDKGVLDYVPLVFVDPETNKHTFSARPEDYGGVIEELSLDDESNPTKLYGTFNLTDEVSKVVEHNPRFGVSVTAHRAYVDEPRNEYYGPMLLDVNATHKPKLNKLGDWERVQVAASSEIREYEVIDLSDATFNVENVEEVNNTNKGKEGEETMPENEGNGVVELSQEQIAALLQHPDVKAAITSEVSSAVQEKDAQITTLSNEIGSIKKESYQTLVKSALGSYKQAGVPPVMVDAAETLMLSFDADERNEKLELSVGEGEEAKTLNLSKVELVTKLLDEAKGFIDLSAEKGSDEDNSVELSKDQEDEAVNFLTGLIDNNS